MVYTYEKNVRVTIEFEVPKRHILRPTTLSTNMVQQGFRWERQNMCSSRLKNYHFGHILKRFSTFNLGAWSFLLVHIWFTPNEGGQRAFKIDIKKKKKADYESRTMTSDHGKKVIFHGPCNDRGDF